MTGHSGLNTDLQLACRGDLWAIRNALKDVEDFLTGHGVARSEIEDITLVLAEAMTNIARHAYSEAKGDIRLTLRLNKRRMQCEIADTGCAFDPSGLGQTAPEPTVFSEGGYGWFIIRSLSDGLSYTRKNGRNNLSFSLPVAAMT